MADERGVACLLQETISRKLTASVKQALKEVEGGLAYLFSFGTALLGGSGVTEDAGGYVRTPNHLERTLQVGVPLFPSTSPDPDSRERLAHTPFQALGEKVAAVLRGGLHHLPEDALLRKSYVKVTLLAFWGPQTWHVDSYLGLRLGGVVSGDGGREILFRTPGSSSPPPPLQLQKNLIYVMDSQRRGIFFGRLEKLVRKQKKEEGRGGRGRQDRLRALLKSLGLGPEIYHLGHHAVSPSVHVAFLVDVYNGEEGSATTRNLTEDEVHLCEELQHESGFGLAEKVAQLAADLRSSARWEHGALQELRTWTGQVEDGEEQLKVEVNLRRPNKKAASARAEEKAAKAQKRGRRGPQSSLYRGVSFHKQTGRWKAIVTTKGERHDLGRYKDEEMAAKAFDKAVIKIRGKDADTNFAPEEYAEEMRSRGASEISVEEFILQLRSEAKRKAKEDKPKRAMTGYQLFCEHVRDRVKEGLTADLAEGEKLTGKVVLCAIAALWSKQDKETKEEWQAKAKERRAAVDQTPERDATSEGDEGQGPSKRPRHEGEGEANTEEEH